MLLKNKRGTEITVGGGEATKLWGDGHLCASFILLYTTLVQPHAPCLAHSCAKKTCSVGICKDIFLTVVTFTVRYTLLSSKHH